MSLSDCIVCKKKVTSSDKDSLQCGICYRWYHAIKCLKYKQEAYTALKQNDALPWFCRLCRDELSEIGSNMKKINDELVKTNAILTDLKVKIDKQDQRIEANENRIDSHEAELNSFKTRLAKLENTEPNLGLNIDQLQSEISQRIQIQNNLVVSGLDETAGV